MIETLQMEFKLFNKVTPDKYDREWKKDSAIVI